MDKYNTTQYMLAMPSCCSYLVNGLI